MTALISTISSTTTDNSQSSLEAAAQKACASLVNHYSDPIHHHTKNDGDDVNELEHFHDEDSSLPCLPPVCEFWYRKLLEVGSSGLAICNESDTRIPLAITRELLYCYESIIRPVLIDSAISINGVVKVIEHYELLLAYFVRNATEHNFSTTTASCDYIDGVVKNLDKAHICNNNIENSSSDELLQIGGIIYGISQDISHWMSKTMPSDDINATNKTKDKVFPCLLRLVGYCVTLLSSSQGIMDVNNKSDVTAFKEALSIATVICVPFVGDGTFKSGNFSIGTLMDWILERSKDDTKICNPMSIAAALKYCSPSPYSVMDDSDLMSSSSFMQRPVIDWSARSANFIAPWSDCLSFRAAAAVLKQIHTASVIGLPSRMNVHDGNEHSSTDILPLLQSISRHVGVQVITSTVRAFFYARLSYPSNSVSNVSDVASKPVGSYIPLVRRIGDEKRELENQKPDVDTSDLTKEHNRFRVSAATLIFCAVLSQHSSFKACDSALSDVIPVALTLLDDVQSFHQGLGAAIILSAIESLSPFEPDTASTPAFVAKFNPFLTSAFETAIRHSGREEAPLITAICFAQSKWIHYLSTLSQHPNCFVPQATANALARKATADMMHRVINQAQFGGRDGNDERIAGMLVAGINPLLALLANLPDAASIEITRVGLSALLPLIGWCGSSLESHAIHISSMTCMLSLMNGAYPIMTKHGGKILTEVMLLLDRSDKDAAYLSETNSDFPCGSDNHTAANVTVKVALYCGAVSLIVCGESAEAVIQHVKSTNLQKPIDRCREICDLSKKIRP
ncbi:hypothetical protein QTG54_008606 [Skeletonema marinoi]|uniref:Uncharacterized protein n=1 Tax=Skeletonema marinoi TaxID=267567 RepID=A0AAD8Y696_9STRA|nr:hypothetical protein QTG54_008606 [Skeletonema marinoi]